MMEPLETQLRTALDYHKADLVCRLGDDKYTKSCKRLIIAMQQTLHQAQQPTRSELVTINITFVRRDNEDDSQQFDGFFDQHNSQTHLGFDSTTIDRLSSNLKQYFHVTLSSKPLYCNSILLRGVLTCLGTCLACSPRKYQQEPMTLFTMTVQNLTPERQEMQDFYNRLVKSYPNSIRLGNSAI